MSKCYFITSPFIEQSSRLLLSPSGFAIKEIELMDLVSAFVNYVLASSSDVALVMTLSFVFYSQFSPIVSFQIF